VKFSLAYAANLPPTKPVSTFRHLSIQPQHLSTNQSIYFGCLDLFQAIHSSTLSHLLFHLEPSTYPPRAIHLSSLSLPLIYSASSHLFIYFEPSIHLSRATHSVILYRIIHLFTLLIGYYWYIAVLIADY
jgi:hypothetical protein